MPWLTKLETMEGDVRLALLQRRLKKGTIIPVNEVPVLKVIASKFVATCGRDFSTVKPHGR